MCRYTRGGFIETAFYIQLGNAILPHLAFVFSFWQILKIHSFSRAARSPAYLARWLDPTPFNVAERLAQGMLTVGLAVLYAPILPVSPVIGLIGLLIQYAADQYIALRHSLKPRAFQVLALDNPRLILRLLPLTQARSCPLAGCC